MKKRIFLPLCALLLIVAAVFLLRGREIGTIRGPEMSEIIVGGVTYVQNNDTGLSYKDKGRFLGRATAGDTTFRIYAVKGDPEGQYLYRRWDWEGAFYERQN